MDFWLGILTGPFFWLSFVGVLIWCEITTVRESHFGLVPLFIFGLFWCWVTKTNPLLWPYQHFMTFMGLLILYAAIGCVWGFVKWWLYLKNHRDAIDLRKVSLQASYEAAKLRDRGLGTFVEYLQVNRFIPVPAENKELISVWIVWWPFSMFWSAFADLLYRLCDWFITHYISVFNRINTAVFGDLNNG